MASISFINVYCMAILTHFALAAWFEASATKRKHRVSKRPTDIGRGDKVT